VSTSLSLPMSPPKRKPPTISNTKKVNSGAKMDVMNNSEPDSESKNVEGDVRSEQYRNDGKQILLHLLDLWAQSIAEMDKAPSELPSGSRYEIIVSCVVAISKLFNLFAKFMEPGFKQFAKNSGLYGRLQSILYMIWSFRVHPSLVAARHYAGLLGSTLTN
jgi:hypothetical protein